MILIPSKMGRLNERSLLERLQQLGTTSRAMLAKSLGLSQPTTGKIVDRFIELGVIEEQGSARWPEPGLGGRRQPGRPARSVRLNQSDQRLLLIQLGVTVTGFARVGLRVGGEDVWPLELPTAGSPEAWLKQLREVSVRLGAGNLWGVLVSAPGIVDEASSRILFSPNLHWTAKADLAGLIQRVWRAPVQIVQEERALAQGHQVATPEATDFLLVEFGEGVGAAIVVGGRILPAPLPLSGEIGHTPVPGNQRPCGCGGLGCLETLISRRGLIQSASEHGFPTVTTWAELVTKLATDPLPGWLETTLDTTAASIAEALNVVGLPRVVLTGTIADLPPEPVAHLARSIQRGSLWSKHGTLACDLAPRRRAMGLIAAGLDRLIAPLVEGKASPVKQKSRAS